MVSLKPTWAWLDCCGVERHVLNRITSSHIPVLGRVKIGVVIYYPACDSPRGFIEANMGLVGMLWGRTNQITSPKCNTIFRLSLSCVE